MVYMRVMYMRGLVEILAHKYKVKADVQKRITAETQMYLSSNKDLNLSKKPITDDFNSIGSWFTTNKEYSSWHGSHTWSFDIPDALFKLYNGEYPKNEWWLYFLDEEVYKKIFNRKIVPDFSRKGGNDYNKYLFNKKYLKAYQDKLISKGYAGLHITPKTEWDGMKDTHVFVIFDPKKEGVSLS
jgi:hypothetical protein